MELDLEPPESDLIEVTPDESTQWQVGGHAIHGASFSEPPDNKAPATDPPRPPGIEGESIAAAPGPPQREVRRAVQVRTTRPRMSR